MHFLYILYSNKHDKFYIGQTHDINTRLLFHNKLSEKSFTSKYRPWSVYFTLQTEDRSIACKIEKYLKKKNKAFITRIKDDTDLQNYIINRFF